MKGEKKNYYFIHLPIDSGLYHVAITSTDKNGKLKGKAIDIPEKECPDHGIVDSRKTLFLYCTTRFEIYDSNGNLLRKGYTDAIDITELQPGVYYLNAFNRTSEFIKKK